MVLRHDRLGLAVGCQKVFETNFPSLGPPWRSHPYIEGCSLHQMVHAVSLGRSSSRYRLDCRPAEWLMWYTSPASAARASETHFSSPGPPLRSHPCIEGCTQRQGFHAVGLGRSSPRHRPIADSQSGLMVYVTGLCCQSLRDEFFEFGAAMEAPS